MRSAFCSEMPLMAIRLFLGVYATASSVKRPAALSFSQSCAEIPNCCCQLISYYRKNVVATYLEGLDDLGAGHHFLLLLAGVGIRLLRWLRHGGERVLVVEGRGVVVQCKVVAIGNGDLFGPNA